MRRNMLNNKFYKYGEKVYMLVATSVYLEYNCVERYLTVEADSGFIFYERTNSDRESDYYCLFLSGVNYSDLFESDTLLLTYSNERWR